MNCSLTLTKILRYIYLNFFNHFEWTSHETCTQVVFKQYFIRIARILIEIIANICAYERNYICSQYIHIVNVQQPFANHVNVNIHQCRFMSFCLTKQMYILTNYVRLVCILCTILRTSIFHNFDLFLDSIKSFFANGNKIQSLHDEFIRQ